MINDLLNNSTDAIENSFIQFTDQNFLFDDSTEEHLPIPVFSYVRPTFGTQFILHILLSLGRYVTEIDLLHQVSLKESFRYAKLIGQNNDEDSLQLYSNNVFVRFIEEQLIYFPNSRSLIDDWITTAGELFDDVIIRNTIPITEIPSVQRTTLASSIEDKCKEYVEKQKKETIQSALKELEDASERCNIPSIDQLLSATKENPLDWNALESFTEPSSLQNDLSFAEQRQSTKICTEAIDDYANVFKSSMIKSCTIRGYAGSGKSWCMQYIMLHCFALGLIGVPTSVMSRRSVFLGSKHIDHMFCLPFDKKI